MKTSTTQICITAAGVALLLALTPALYASADARDSARAVLRPAPVTISPPSPVQAPHPAPLPPQGGITSVTEGSISTGDNTGGTVTTGDGHVDVHEVNIGPTNPPPVVAPGGGEVTPPPVQPPCSSDPRASNACRIEVQPRTR